MSEVVFVFFLVLMLAPFSGVVGWDCFLCLSGWRGWRGWQKCGGIRGFNCHESLVVALKSWICESDLAKSG